MRNGEENIDLSFCLDPQGHGKSAVGSWAPCSNHYVAVNNRIWHNIRLRVRIDKNDVSIYGKGEKGKWIQKYVNEKAHQTYLNLNIALCKIVEHISVRYNKEVLY